MTALTVKRDLEVSDLPAEAGAHAHSLDRSSGATLPDGAHRHLFLLPDGSVLLTEEDGAHEHALSEDGNSTSSQGRHVHEVRLADGTVLTTGDSASGHAHDLLVEQTAWDGTHVHTLRLPDGEDVKSLLAGDFVEAFARAEEGPEDPSTLGRVLGKALALDLDEEGGLAFLRLTKSVPKFADVLLTLGRDLEDLAEDLVAVPPIEKAQGASLSSIAADLKLILSQVQDEGLGARLRRAIDKLDVLDKAHYGGDDERRRRKKADLSTGDLATGGGRLQPAQSGRFVVVALPESRFAVVDLSAFQTVSTHDDREEAQAAADRRNETAKKADVKTLAIEVSGDEDSGFEAMVAHIGKLAGIGHSFPVVVDPDDSEFRKSFSFDGDGSFRLSVVGARSSKADEEVHKALRFEILKQEDEEERTVLGVVLEPEVVDAQGDIYSAEEIRKTAFRFMEEYQQFGLMHKQIVRDVLPLECYLAPVDFKLNEQVVRKGTWLLRVRVHDDVIWKRVKTGELTGFSIGGTATRTPETIKT